MEYLQLAAATLQGTGRKTTTVVAAAAASTTSSDEVVVMMMAGDSSHHQHALHSHPQQGSIMVGKNNEFHTVKAMLIQQSSKQREIVSIKSMRGIGKTTLARQVYEDPSIASHFDIRAWVVASQNHNTLQMLTDLLKSMGGCVVDSSTEEDQLAEQLYQNLLHQRYFVVIDDIWSIDAWDSIKACFPDNANGSQVLLTTRFTKVATSIGSNNEEWKLLEKENFDQLIYLEIDSICDLKQWEARVCHFPKLEHLVLKRCTKLVKIPTKFAKILNLKSIELDNYCLPSVMDSANKIREKQCDQGNENMVVIEEIQHTIQV